jgi:tyrosinase
MSSSKSEDAGSTIAGDPGAATSSGPAVQPRLRRPIDALTPSELDRYRNAIGRMIRLEDNRGYHFYAGIPGLPQPSYVQLGNLLFLPWNRMMLLSFERALMNMDPEVSLPWWDFAQPLTGGALPYAFAVETIEGAHNRLHSVRLPAAVLQESVGTPTRTFREPSREALSADTTADVEAMLALTDFEGFSYALLRLHNHAHVMVGGTLGEVSVAAYDPLYWSLQANVDRLWRMWQIRNPGAGIPPDIANNVLTPFSVKADEVLDTEALGYDYDLGGGLPALVAGATGASSDVPSLDGGFGFRSYAEAFATLIASPLTKPPLTIGIYGSWGMGKSSLLKQIGARLEERDPEAHSDQTGLGRRRLGRGAPPPPPAEDVPQRVHVVEFRAWDYSANKLVWPALVRKAMDCLEAERGRWTRYAHRLKRNVRREWLRRQGRILATAAVAVAFAVAAVAQLNISLASASAALVLASAAGALGIAGKAASSPMSRWLGTLLEDVEYGRQTDLMSEIRGDLEFLGEHLGDGARMLVVIDDLDRCEASKAVEVLQAINLLLNFPSFVVCIGVDARILTEAIETHYRGLLGDAGASGYEYLDKIIQIPFRIPDPTTDHLQDFLAREINVQATSSTLGKGEYKKAEDLVEPGADAAEPVPGDSGEFNLAGGSSSLGDMGREAQKTPFASDELQAFVGVAPYLRPNPRHIKRLINTYRLVRTLAQHASEQTVLEHRTSVIHWLAVSAQWPYSSYIMTRRFEQLQETSMMEIIFLNGDLLRWIYTKSEAMIDPAVQTRLDDDPNQLRALLDWIGADLSARDFQTIQRYTINFNPAVAELPVFAAPLAVDTPLTVDDDEEPHPKRSPPVRAPLLELVSRVPGLTVAEAAKLLEVPERSIKRAAATLERQGSLSNRDGALRIPSDDGS